MRKRFYIFLMIIVAYVGLAHAQDDTHRVHSVSSP